MKSFRILLLLFLALFLAGKASTQASLVIFSENGEKFTAYLNGSLVSDKPASRIEAGRPGGPSFKARIVFEETTIPEISKTIFNSPGPEMFYVIRKSDKGKFILEKTSSEYVSHNDNAAAAEDKGEGKKEPAKTEEVKGQPKPAEGSGKGCQKPMEEGQFIASREIISNAPFDGPKLLHAKSIAEKNCLSTTQIIEVLGIFSGESSRLNFAKFAYRHCWDPGNYGSVKDILSSSAQEDLQRYIDSLK